MAIPQENVAVMRARRGARLGWVGMLALATGCVSSGQINPFTQLCPTQVCEMVVTWNHQVMTCPDPFNNGQLNPGLMGRMYLFGAELGAPVIGDGGIAVTLYDDGPLADGGQSIMLEEWRIDPATLRRLVRKDMFGMGYTLFLPWATYRPGICMVHLKVRYDPAKGGMPMFADSGPLTLENPAPTKPGDVTAAKRGVPTGVQQVRGKI